MKQKSYKTNYLHYIISCILRQKLPTWWFWSNQILGQKNYFLTVFKIFYICYPVCHRQHCFTFAQLFKVFLHGAGGPGNPCYGDWGSLSKSANTLAFYQNKATLQYCHDASVIMSYGVLTLLYDTAVNSSVVYIIDWYTYYK